MQYIERAEVKAVQLYGADSVQVLLAWQSKVEILLKKLRLAVTDEEFEQLIIPAEKATVLAVKIYGDHNKGDFVIN